MKKKGTIYLREDLQWGILYLDRNNSYPISNETRVLNTSKYKIMNPEHFMLEENDLVEFEVITGKYTCGKEMESARIIKLIK